jgi:triosephosphate isomerase
MQTKHIIIGNLKQNPNTVAEVKKIYSLWNKLALGHKKISFGLCVSPVFITEGKKSLKTKTMLYSQKVSSTNNGAHTGEISATQIKSVGARGALVGHSERRGMGETNENIKDQVQNLIQEKMHTILCVGEKVRDGNNYIQEVEEQIVAALGGLKKTDAVYITVAYEPVWAIGSNATRPATENEIHEMAIVIHKKLIEIFGKKNGSEIPILYGGSANSTNAKSILAIHHINGFLLGRASLDKVEMCKICSEITG